MRDPRGSDEQRRSRRRRRRETIIIIANLRRGLDWNLRRLRVLLVFVVKIDHIHARVHVVRTSIGLRLPLHRAPVQRRGRRRRDG